MTAKESRPGQGGSQMSRGSDNDQPTATLRLDEARAEHRGEVQARLA